MEEGVLYAIFPNFNELTILSTTSGMDGRGGPFAGDVSPSGERGGTTSGMDGRGGPFAGDVSPLGKGVVLKSGEGGTTSGVDGRGGPFAVNILPSGEGGIPKKV
jgi:hypothetical protein